MGRRPPRRRSLIRMPTARTWALGFIVAMVAMLVLYTLQELGVAPAPTGGLNGTEPTHRQVCTSSWSRGVSCTLVPIHRGDP